MPLSPPSYQELYDRFRRQMETLGFNHWAEGSAIGAITKTFAAYMTDLWSTLADIEAQTDPSTARGIYLDRMGAMFGVTRLPPQSASTLGRGSAVKFTNNGSTAGTIPAGARVWSAANPLVAFFTTRTITIAGGAEGFVDVVAGQAGDNYNLGAQALDSHNAGMGQYSVTNIRPIGGGTFTETDDAFRFRISQALAARDGATEAALRAELLKVPGLRDAVIKGGVRGAGTVDVMVIPIDRYASQALMDAASQVIADNVAAGISWRVMPPKTRRVDISIQLRLAPGIDLASVQPGVEAAVRGYLDNLRVNDGRGGADLIYAELVSRIQDATPDIVDSVVDLTVDGIPTLQTNVLTGSGERLVSGSVSIR